MVLPVGGRKPGLPDRSSFELNTIATNHTTAISDIDNALSGASSTTRSHRGHQAVTVAASDSPLWMKHMADYHPDLSGSDADHLQDAINEAQTYVSSGSAKTPVQMMPGTHHWDKTVTKRSAALIGGVGGGSVSTWVEWDGAAGGTALKYSNSDSGVGSFDHIAGIRFQEGDTAPGIWIDMTTAGVFGLIDVFSQLEWVHFSGGDIQIKVGAWVNLHWNHLRFDGWGDVAIELNPDAAQFMSSFLLDQFTADNGHSGDGGPGFLRINRPGSGVFFGIVELSNARIEFNRQLPSSGAAGVVIIDDPESSSGYGLTVLRNIAYHDVHGNTNDVLIYRDSAHAKVERYRLQNVGVSGLSATVGGTWTAAYQVPPVPSSGVFADYNSYNDLQVAYAAQLGFFPESLTTSYPLFTSFNGSKRLEMRGDGRLEWGGSGSPRDTNLYRAGANILATDDAFRVMAVASTSRPSPSTVGAGTMIFDTTLGKPLWSNGTNWVDATGSTP